MKLDAVVVIYNPDLSILKNILSYLVHIDRLYIVDNSDKKNFRVIEQIKTISSKCTYIENSGNQGIAQALNIGANLAIEDGAEWLLTMDQDSIFEEDNFSKLVYFTKKQDKNTIGLVSPFHESTIITKQEGIVEEVLLTMTSGNFINLLAYKKINGFDERFFIDAVDWDYCIRLNLNNYKVLRVNNIFLKHELGNNAKVVKSFLSKERVIQNYNYIRRYYITRNKLLISKLYVKEYPDISFRWRISILADIRNILLYEQSKFLKLREVLRGIKDFKIGKFYER